MVVTVIGQLCGQESTDHNFVVTIVNVLDRDQAPGSTVPTNQVNHDTRRYPPPRVPPQPPLARAGEAFAAKGGRLRRPYLGVLPYILECGPGQ